MDVFFALFNKLLPLYIIIGLGFIAGKYLGVQGVNIAKLMFYIIAPVIFLHGLMHTHIDLSVLSLPLLVFLVGTGLCFLFIWIGRKIWDNALPNVLGLVAGTGNTGFFGLPVALLLFDDNTVGIYITAFLGIAVFENSVGFYVTAKGSHSGRESLLKVIKLPALYALIAGATLSMLHVPAPAILDDLASHMRGAYTVLGMMIIGFGIARERDKIEKEALGHYRFLGLSFLVKFVVWPIVIAFITLIDQQFFQFYNPEIYKALFLLSIMPIAANTVVIATLLNAHPEKVATTLFASTVFALLYVPLMVALFL